MAALTVISPRSTSSSLIPSSPLASFISIFSNVVPVTTSYTVLRAASITPPVAPNMTAAPVESPNMGSKASSSKSTKSTLACFIILANSLVVKTASTS